MLARIRVKLISRAYARIWPYTGWCSLTVKNLLRGAIGPLCFVYNFYPAAMPTLECLILKIKAQRPFEISEPPQPLSTQIVHPRRYIFHSTHYDSIGTV